jgi:hypothetical protein
MKLIDRKFLIPIVALLVLATISSPGTASAQQRYPIEVRSEWTLEGRYTKQHVIDVGDVPGHQLRILEIYRTYNEKSRFAVSGVKVKESFIWGFTDYITGIGTALAYGVWILEDGEKVFSERSGSSQTQPTGAGSYYGTYHGTLKITGGTGRYRGIRGTMTEVVEFNTDLDRGYNRQHGIGEYWFVE